MQTVWIELLQCESITEMWAESDASLYRFLVILTMFPLFFRTSTVHASFSCVKSEDIVCSSYFLSKIFYKIIIITRCEQLLLLLLLQLLHTFLFIEYQQQATHWRWNPSCSFVFLQAAIDKFCNCWNNVYFFTFVAKTWCKFEVKTVSPQFRFYLRFKLLLMQVKMIKLAWN